MLTLLSSSLPLASTFTSVALVITSSKLDNIVELDSKSLGSAESLHVFAFTSSGQLLLSESEGSFTIEEWEAVHDRAKQTCSVAAQDDRMHVGGEVLEVNMKQWLRDTVQEQVGKDQAWKS